MRAFISYSISDRDEYILTLLSSKLRKQGFSISTSQNFFLNVLDFTTKIAIDDSHLFIGIITRKSNNNKRVIEEWQYAKKAKIPNLFLVEDNVLLNERFRGNVIKFNRHNPGPALDLISERMHPTKQKSSTRSLQKKEDDDTMSWVLGGAAVLAIIALLSDKK